MADKIVMGYWDCPSCGSTGIPGTTYDCPNCGRQRGKETKFYMKEGKVKYIQGHKVQGADWYCEFCGALNSACKTTCENCGSQKSESKDDYFSLKQPKTEQTINNNTQNTGSNERTPKSRSKLLWVVGFIILFLIAQNMITKFINKPRDYKFDVQQLTWENSIDIEENRTFSESDWYLPNGGRLDHTALEIRSYQSVLDHYESVQKSREVQSGGHYETSYSDNGDGTFTEESTYVPDYTTEYYYEQEPVYREEPIYDTKYYYDIDRWVYDRTETTTGTDKKPYWPELNLNDKEREADHYSSYTMSGVRYYKSFGKSKKKEETYKIQESWWKDIEVGQTLSLTLEGEDLADYKKD